MPVDEFGLDRPIRQPIVGLMYLDCSFLNTYFKNGDLPFVQFKVCDFYLGAESATCLLRIMRLSMKHQRKVM